MKLYGSTRSPFVRKVLLAAHELGLHDRLQLVPVIVSPFTPDLTLVTHNPLLKIPTLVVEDGVPIYDSGVICQYLDGLAGNNRLVPPGTACLPALTLHATANGLMEILIFWLSLRTRLQPAALADLAAATWPKLDRTLDLFEAQCQGWDAARLHLGTLTAGVALGYIDFRFGERGWRRTRPALADWYAVFAARPSARATEYRE